VRHNKKRNKLSRDSAERKALLSNLSKQLIEHARRQALAALHNDKFIVHKLFDEVAPRYSERPGGYTRIIKLGPRRSDSTEMVYLELV
jgi:large subunit ribosomal protein L17